MKVIIQDTKTKRYFSPDGRWVAAEDEAKDFVSLMRAYYFAKQLTTGHFEVLLYSPDDNYRTSIIEGDGMGAEDMGENVTCVVVTGSKSKIAACKKTGGSVWARFNACMTSTRNYLN